MTMFYTNFTSKKATKKQAKNSKRDYRRIISFNMISYAPFWETLEKSKETTYTLIYKHRLSSSKIDRLRKNKPVNTTTINDLCRILDCGIEDILTYEPSEKDQFL